MSDQIFHEYKLSNKVIVLFNLSKQEVETFGCSRLHWSDCSVKIGFRKNNTFIIDFDNLSFGVRLTKSGQTLVDDQWSGYLSTYEKFVLDYKLPPLDKDVDYELCCWCNEGGQKLEYRDIIRIEDWQEPFPSSFKGKANTVIYHSDYIPTAAQLKADAPFLPPDPWQ